MRNSGRQWGRRRVPVLIIFVLLITYTGWALKRPLPAIAPTKIASLHAVKAHGSLTWPTGGQAAVGIAGSDVLETHGPQNSSPIASTAKLITALAVLQKKPLAPGEQGPTITLTERDVALYNFYHSQGGSVMPVVAGEKISEYQMLQAIMLPSANNIADSLAIWAFGSMDAYRSYASKYISELGLKDTHIGSDASGLAPNTTSSARDLVKIGKAAMDRPVLAGIVGQPAASGLPIVGTAKNVNFLLGTKGIVGIKTGNTDEAGGVFVGAAKTKVNGKSVTIVTAVLGSPTLFVAMKDSLNLIQSAQTNFKPVIIVKAGEAVGSYKIPWGEAVPAAATKDLVLKAWGGTSTKADIRLQKMSSNNHVGQKIGNVIVNASAFTDTKSVPVILKTSPGQPTLRWRLTHPF